MNEQPTFDAPKSNDWEKDTYIAHVGPLKTAPIGRPNLWEQAAVMAGWTGLMIAEPDVMYGHRRASDTIEAPDKLRRVPNYPHDIAAAMELWDLLLADGYTVEMFSRKPGCYAVVIGYGGARYGDDIEDTSPARAITRAFVSVGAIKAATLSPHH